MATTSLELGCSFLELVQGKPSMHLESVNVETTTTTTMSARHFFYSPVTILSRSKAVFAADDIDSFFADALQLGKTLRSKWCDKLVFWRRNFRTLLTVQRASLPAWPPSTRDRYITEMTGYPRLSLCCLRQPHFTECSRPSVLLFWAP